MAQNLKGFLIFKVHFPKWGIYLLRVVQVFQNPEEYVWNFIKYIEK